MKIVHYSDIHIRNFKYFDEYRQTFKNFIESVRSIKPDIIVNTADTFHTKTQTSPEAYILAKEFLAEVSSIAPHYIILGNHDCIQAEPDRLSSMDVIFPDIHNLHFLKSSGIYKIDDCANFVVYSIADKKFPNKADIDQSKLNIGLYHGVISGCRINNSVTLVSDVGPEIFDGCDYVMLGDIHRVQKVDSDGRMYYAGSLIQQDFGEDPDKGFLLWTINGKNSHSVDFVGVDSPQKFYTFRINDTNIGHAFDEIKKIAGGSRVRLIFSNTVSRSDKDKFIDMVNHFVVPKETKVIDDVQSAISSKASYFGFDFMINNLRNLDVQRNLIKTFLDANSIKYAPEAFELAIDINSKIDQDSDENKDIIRNTNICFDEFSFSNLFSYGPRNKIDFASLNGSVGIFGKNGSGKSSIINAILLTIFDKTALGVSRNDFLINNMFETAEAKLDVTIGEDKYVIRRKIERVMNSSSKSKTTVDLEVNGDKPPAVGDLRYDAEKEIRKVFGNYNDFCLTCISPQGEFSNFINSRSAERRHTLARFLDVGIFDEKYRRVKSEHYDISRILASNNIKSMEEEIISLIGKAEKFAKESSGLSKSSENVQSQLDDLKILLSQINNKLGKFGSINISDLKEKHSCLVRIGREMLDDTDRFSKEMDAYEHSFKLSFIDEKKFAEVNERRKIFEKLGETKRLLEERWKSNKAILDEMRVGNIGMSDLPCSSKASECPLYANVSEQNKRYNDAQNRNDEIASEIDRTNNEINNICYDANEYESMLEKQKIRVESESNIMKLRSKMEKLNANILSNSVEIDKIESVLNECGNIDNIDSLMQSKRETEEKISSLIKSQAEYGSEKQRADRSYGVAATKINMLRKEVVKFKEMQGRLDAYNILMLAFGKNGIAYEILKNSIPIINAAIADILSCSVKFDVFLTIDDESKKIDIWIKHKNSSPTLIDLASGGQKFIASVAIRVALLKITSLPKSNSIFIDEGFGVLDPENLESVTKMIDKIKDYFKSVFIITHVPELKGFVNQAIDVVIGADRVSHLIA